MKVIVEPDEWYPVYVIRKEKYSWEDDSCFVEVPDDIIKDYEEALILFGNAEDRLAEYG